MILCPTRQPEISPDGVAEGERLGGGADTHNLDIRLQVDDFRTV